MEKKKRKQNLREKVRLKLAALSEEAVRKKSLAIFRCLTTHPLYRRAKVIFCYVSKPKEVNTHLLIKQAIRQKKKVFVPKHVRGKDHIVARRLQRFDKELRRGRFGILEPFGKGEQILSLKKVDLFVLPGMAFDRHGGRLGWGKGTFDRFLEKWHDPKRCVGLALESQIVPRLPREPHDITVGHIFTEKRTITVKMKSMQK